ncbi:AfsR/SARP family transcriptional regulator [Kribbella sp. NBC_00359]|uniref:AfsR/SARP family transcriptional regulator n=1 Tax=Kribbella sp. NBC_00359 TaxID=2975966 RepID=UPI002E236AD4
MIEVEPTVNSPHGGDAIQGIKVLQVHIRLLGHLDVLVDGESLDVRGLRRQAILAALALNAGGPISSDQLIDVVWPGNPPATAINTLQSHISYLRRMIRVPGVILASSSGYTFDPAKVSSDLRLAEELIGEAGRERTVEDRAALLATALEMWRGRPLSYLRSLPWFCERAQSIDQAHHSAAKAAAEARLALGDHAALVPILLEMVTAHPFDEDLAAQLIIALYRAGRQAEALEVFRRTRDTLSEELGIDPGHNLRELERAVLSQSPTLNLPASRPTGSCADRSAQPVTQLPAANTVTLGRQRELARLSDLATRSRRRSTQVRGATRPIVLAGLPGVGKTTLALRWAHNATGHFPDGQLYVNLWDDRPRSPEDALTQLLSALGVTGDQLPVGVASMSGLYRSLLVGRRMLILLDDAQSADQIRPLIPCATDCLVLITSRSDLTSLVVTDGAELLHVEPLRSAHGLALLELRLGDSTTERAKAAAERIVEACGGLPLALAIAAGRTQSLGADLTATVAHTQSSGDLLSFLNGGDLATDLRSVFERTFMALNARSLRLLQLLSARTSGSFTLCDAAAISQSPDREAFAMVCELAEMNLVQSTKVADVYDIHPIVRVCACELQSGVTDSRFVA